MTAPNAVRIFPWAQELQVSPTQQELSHEHADTGADPESDRPRPITARFAPHIRAGDAQARSTGPFDSGAQPAAA